MITDAKLRALKPRQSVYRIADALGLAIEVRPSGARLWRYRYRFNGTANMLGLGEYPGVTLNEARELREQARKSLAIGIDPSAQRKAEAEAATSKADRSPPFVMNLAILALKIRRCGAHARLSLPRREGRLSG